MSHFWFLLTILVCLNVTSSKRPLWTTQVKIYPVSLSYHLIFFFAQHLQLSAIFCLLFVFLHYRVISMRVTTLPCSLLYSQCLQQRVEHKKYSIGICGMVKLSLPTSPISSLTAPFLTLFSRILFNIVKVPKIPCSFLILFPLSKMPLN